MDELIKILNNMPNSYYDFVIGISDYAKRKPSRLQAVKAYLEDNPNATTSNVVQFVIMQPDFYEENVFHQNAKVG